MTMKPPYCEINGLVCTDVVSSVDIRGGDLKSSEQAIPGRRTGDILDAGRNPRTIQVNARFLTEEDLDDFIAHVNSAPEDCEAYPFRDDRCAYIKKAHAQVSDPEVATIEGEETTFFRGKAMLHTREPWMYGIEKGVRYESPQALPITTSLEHEGTVEKLAALDKLCARGQYKYGLGYVEDLKLTFTPTGGSARDILLCSKMMTDDIFEVDRFGDVEHSYENDFDCTFSKLQSDLHSATYCAYCSITDEKLTISGEGRCVFPFYGPLPLSAERPYLDFDVVSIGEYAPKIVAGVLSDLSDLTEIVTDLHIGTNRVHIPGYEGQRDFFMGFIERRCWVSGPNLATARVYLTGGGDSGNAICMGGYTGGNVAVTEEFNGTAWSAGGNLATARRMLAGGGDAGNAICMGGLTTVVSAVTEEYNGTSWGAGGNLATARRELAGGGNAGNAICMGGDTGAMSAVAEKYNGTSWSSAGNLTLAREALAGGGISSSAVAMGGYDGSFQYPTAEIYDGTSWSQVSPMAVARSYLAGDGDQFTAICMGGVVWQPVATTETFDGTSWSTGGNLITARYGLTGGGMSYDAICMGGIIPGNGLEGTLMNNTETYGRNGSIVLESIKAVVQRYIDPDTIPTVDPEDTFELKIDSDGAEELAYLELYFRDAWWF